MLSDFVCGCDKHARVELVEVGVAASFMELMSVVGLEVSAEQNAKLSS
jgi:hypothetical protein